MSVKIDRSKIQMDSVKVVSECIRKVKQLEQKNDLTNDLINDKILLGNNLFLTPPTTEPDSPASDEQNKDFQDFIEIPDDNTNLSCLSNEHVNQEENKNQVNSLKNSKLSIIFACKWTNCDWPGCNDDLVDHIREIHVELQPYHYHDHVSPSFQNVVNRSSKHQINQTQTYVCLWEGCKVYGKTSLCKSWLENHVLQHSGPRPFKCIFEGCGQRFKTRTLLEKHVNNHFTNSTCDCKNILECRHLSNCELINVNSLKNHNNHTNSLTMNGTSSSLIGSNGSTPSKCSKKKKNAKLNRRLPTVRSNNQDLFDECTMHHLKYSLMQLNSITGLDIIGDQRVLTFYAKIIGKCHEEKTGVVKLLLHWEPEDIIDDTWVSENDANKMLVKKVPLSSLPVEGIDKIGEFFFPKEKSGRKQKRK